MKNKKLVAVLGAAGLLAVGTAAYFGFNSGAAGSLLEDDAFRTVADIDGEEFHYFDSEAVALAESSKNDAGLRAVAIEASNLVNDERAVAGLEPLEWDQNLESVSHVRAEECSINFSHTRPDGRKWYTVNSKIQGGENLAFGFDNAEDAVDAWMNSPTHRDNILYPDFQEVAISCYRTDDGTVYWAQEYGY